MVIRSARRALLVMFLGLWICAAAPPGKEAFDRGRQLYLETRYAEALPYLLRAHEASGGRPSTVEALALCYRSLGRKGDALAQYEALLRLDDDEPKATEVRTAIAELKAELAAQRAVRAAPPVDPAPEPDNFATPLPRVPSPPPPPNIAGTRASDDSSVFESPWLWIAAAAAVVAGVGAVVVVSANAGEALPDSITTRFER